MHHEALDALTQARCAGSTSPRWTGHLTPKGYAISTVQSTSSGAGVRAGQWLTREEEDAGGAMAGVNWSLCYSVLVH